MKKALKAIYHIKAGQLLIETGKHHSNGIATFQKIRTKFVDTEEEARKYVTRYLRNHSFEASKY